MTGSSDTEDESLAELQQPQPEVVDLVSSDTEPESLQCKWHFAAYRGKANSVSGSQPEIDAPKSSDTEPESLGMQTTRDLAVTNLFCRYYAGQGLGVVHSS